jgi:CRISPR/Cas system-associated exonuclease Cas4 (RecB family)
LTAKKIVKLHTIDQWMELDKAMRPIILQHIKLKDRLYKFLKEKWAGNKKETLHNEDSKWRPCPVCDKRGWIPTEPRLPGIHPSQLPHPCLLKTYNEMTGKEGQEKIEARTMLIFDMGHAIHDMLQSYGRMGAWGPEYHHEVRLSKDLQELSETLMIEGHADAENILVIDDIPDSPYIYEVGLVHEYKSINSNGFEKLTRPKPEHKVQAMVYAAALNRPIVVYLYFNKNDSNIADFPVAFEPELWTVIEGKARLLKSHFESKTPPPASTGFHCNQCPYVYGCEAYAAMTKYSTPAKK